MTITKERLQALIDNPIDERIMNHERLDILKMALSSIELHTDSLQNYRESLGAYQDYIKSLREENERFREALERASEFANKDDVNGQAGDIAREALKGAE